MYNVHVYVLGIHVLYTYIIILFQYTHYTPVYNWVYIYSYMYYTHVINY